ncbi:hypothetical protein QUF74_19830 [Candidatus Halobeggiatoa sp. HSG11]|nr:hypothetical protein [Candidatus Halobeggiatoa sp. HSG11]
MHKTTGKSHALKIYDPVLKRDIFTKLVRIILFSIVIFITVFSFNWYYVDTGQLLDLVVMQKLEDKTFSRSKENYLIGKNHAVENELYRLDDFHRVRFISVPYDTTLKSFDKTKDVEAVAKRQQFKKEFFSKVNNPIEQVSHQKLREPKLVTKTVQTSLETIVLNLQQCEQHLNANRLTTGKQGTALDCYQQILLSDPTNVTAKEGLVKIEQRYQGWAKVAIERRNFKKAQNYLKSLKKVNPKSAALSRLNRLFIRSQTLVKKTTQRKQPATKRVAKQSSHITKKISKRCNDIFSQESLGIRSLTDEQKKFKQKYCK